MTASCVCVCVMKIRWFCHLLSNARVNINTLQYIHTKSSNYTVPLFSRYAIRIFHSIVPGVFGVVVVVIVAFLKFKRPGRTRNKQFEVEKSKKKVPTVYLSVAPTLKYQNINSEMKHTHTHTQHSMQKPRYIYSTNNRILTAVEKQLSWCA